MRKPDPNLYDKRREQIINISAALFARKNFHEVRMDEVARECGVAKGSVYNYFSTKEDLYLSIIMCRMESLLELLQHRIDYKQTPLINIRRIVIHMYSFMSKYPHFFQIWYKEKLNCERHSHQKIGRIFHQIRNLLKTALNKGIDGGVIHPIQTTITTDLIFGTIDAAVIRGRTLSTEQRKEERMRLFEFILRAIGTEKALEMHAAGLDNPGEISNYDSSV
ncbi:MAG: TetR/AcrR family transcriptional regulator [Calditrichaeota bacterium]|nr:TetR/AcrR family transcriptional regulator [Calditrichota bacterium]RQW08643.1 MAG: TetR/AcrR family transcriptional regulator [Calditrichota bacterium]